MAIYTEIEFTVIDKDKYIATENGLWFEFIDENGNRLPFGADSAGSIEATDAAEPVDGNPGSFIQKGSLRAAETLPEEITLRGYNANPL